MPEAKHHWKHLTVVVLINLLVIGLYFAGRSGRRDHFVITLHQGSLSFSRNGKILADSIRVDDMPIESGKGIRLSVATLTQYQVPTRQSTSVDNIVFYSGDGKDVLFRPSEEVLTSSSYSNSGPVSSSVFLDMTDTPTQPQFDLLLSPAGVPLNDFRLEFDVINGVILWVRPINLETGETIELEHRWFSSLFLEYTIRRAKTVLAQGHAMSRPYHLLRTLLFQLADSYPRVIAFSVAFLVAQLLLLTPICSLWVRLNGRFRRLSFFILLFVFLLACTIAGATVWLGLSVVLKFLGNWSLVLTLASLVVAPTILFALRGVFRKPTGSTSPVAGNHNRQRTSPLRTGSWCLLVGISILFGTAMIVVITSSILDRVPHIEDSSAQLMHANMVAKGSFSAPATDALDFGHFHHRWMLVHGGRWFSQYPPGHIVIMALGVMAGAPWILPGLISGLTLLTVYFIGVRLAGRCVGLISVWLMIFSPFFQMMGGTFMNHTSATLYWSVGLLCFVLGVQKRRFLCFVGCGFMLFMLFATRPLTAVGLAAPLIPVSIIWVFVRDRKNRFTALCGVLVGIIPPIILFLAFNFGTTGNAFLMGYDLTGTTKLVESTSTNPIAVQLQRSLYQIWMLRRTFLNWPLCLEFAPILALFVIGRARRWDWLLLASSVGNVVAWMPYTLLAVTYGPRFYYESVPALCILAARGLREIAVLGSSYIDKATLDHNTSLYQRCGWYAALSTIVICFTSWTVNDFVLGNGPNRAILHYWVPSHLSQLKNWHYVDRSLEQEVETLNLDNAVVFTAVVTDEQYRSIFPLNSPLFDSNVLYARCLGSRRDRRLMKLFPDRKAYIAWFLPTGWKVEPYPEHLPVAVPPAHLGIQAVDGSLPQLRASRDDSQHALAAKVAQSYEGWQLVSSQDDPTAQVLCSTDDKDDIVQLLPISRNIPAALRWQGLIKKGKNTILSFEIASPPDRRSAGTLVQVWIGEELLAEAHTNELPDQDWVPLNVDISPFSDREVVIEVLLIATQHDYAFACIRGLRFQ